MQILIAIAYLIVVALLVVLIWNQPMVSDADYLAKLDSGGKTAYQLYENFKASVRGITPETVEKELITLSRRKLVRIEVASSTDATVVFFREKRNEPPSIALPDDPLLIPLNSPFA